MSQSSNSRIIVLYYTRTGKTRTVAETVSGTLDCRLQEIQDLKDRAGILHSNGMRGNFLTKVKRRSLLPPDKSWTGGGRRVKKLFFYYRSKIPVFKRKKG